MSAPWQVQVLNSSLRLVLTDCEMSVLKQVTFLACGADCHTTSYLQQQKDSVIDKLQTSINLAEQLPFKPSPVHNKPAYSNTAWSACS